MGVGVSQLKLSLANDVSCVDGRSEGFGEPIATLRQIVNIVQAAKALKRVYRVDSDRPVCSYSP